MWSKTLNAAARIAALLAFICAGGAWFAAHAQPAASPTQSQPTAKAGSPGSNDYRLGPGDKVRIIVFGEKDLTGEFFVSEAGKVSFPLIGEVDATGKSLEGFRAELQQRLAAGYLKDPRVNVEVLTYRPFYILGEVTKPGEYPYSSGLTILKAVATAGGFTYRAQTKRVFIRHLNETSEKVVPLTTDLAVEPGDTIRVGERFF